MLDKNKNPWTHEDELEHPNSVLEWWAVETFFKTTKNKKKWSLKAGFDEWDNKSKEKGSYVSMTLFDQDTGKIYTYINRSNHSKLKMKKDCLHLSYDTSYLKGGYPSYEFFIDDKKNDIKLHINYKAISLPHWISQDVTNGWLPMGIGFYRYGFIPKCEATGKITIKNKTFDLQGTGYYEHVWGDIWYDNPLSGLSNVKRSTSIYTKLVGWWIKNHKFSIPKTLKFSTENNPFGYDWAWAVLDNGWTIYFGNILFWLMQGPIMGTLVLSKDGVNYKEYSNVQFKYNKTSFSKNFDFTYPTEIELFLKDGKEQLNLILKMTGEVSEYIADFTENKLWKGFVICESPGTADGYYYDGDKKTKLSGICKIEPQRQVSTTGHNSLQIDFLKPPKGVGVSFKIDSHFLKKRIDSGIQLAPRPKITFKIKKINQN